MSTCSRSKRTRAGAAAALLVALALGLGACSGATASNLPTIPGLPTVPPGGAGSACLDAPTIAILDQLKASGADVPSLLVANKDKLIAGLNQFQPTDSAVVIWRDAVVAAIRSGDADIVAAQVAILANGQVTIPPC